MCGRFTLRTSPAVLAEIFEVLRMPDFEPRYNIAPTQQVVAVRQNPALKHREAALLRWGLVPSWADDPSIGNRLINARADTVATKPSFRSAFKSRRCLVLADGFYEWQKIGSRKQPYLITLRNGAPFAFAGLWESWKKAEPPLESCTLITTDANAVLEPIHDRMPVILPEEHYDAWLNPATPAAELQELLKPYPASEMQSQPVSTLVNNPRNDSPECVRPLE